MDITGEAMGRTLGHSQDRSSFLMARRRLDSLIAAYTGIAVDNLRFWQPDPYYDVHVLPTLGIHTLQTLPREEDIQQLEDLLETSESTRVEFINYFCPSTEVFNRDHIGQRVYRACQARGGYKVLSAGCSSGAELYSIAMEFATRGITDATLTGVDINRKALHKAREGRYKQTRTSVGFQYWGLSERQRREYTMKEEDETVITPEIRGYVSFHEGNVVTGFEEIPEQQFDVVLCRNVLKYLTEENRKAALRNVRKHIAGNGCFIIGKREQKFCHPEDVGFRRARNFTTECPRYSKSG